MCIPTFFKSQALHIKKIKKGKASWSGNALFPIPAICKGQLISKGLLVSSILQKNDQKQVDLRYHSTVGQIFGSIFGRIQDTNKSF